MAGSETVDNPPEFRGDSPPEIGDILVYRSQNTTQYWLRTVSPTSSRHLWRSVNIGDGDQYTAEGERLVFNVQRNGTPTWVKPNTLGRYERRLRGTG
jgi:hypothetical protein